MDTSRPRRLRAALLYAALLFTPAAQATLLAAFDFDGPSGAFEFAPEYLHAALAEARFSASHAALTDFAGNPGRALASNGFTLGNTIVLDLIARAGHTLAITAIAFDARVSSSGPRHWQIELTGAAARSGVLATHFAPIAVSYTASSLRDRLRMALGGTGASAASGTLRIDNLVVTGRLGEIPAPAPATLMLAPVLAWLSRRALRLTRSATAIRAIPRPAGNRVRA